MLLALCVRFTLGPGVWFRQQRLGRHGKPFTLFKFRTMTQAGDTQGRLLPDAARLSPFGRFLRHTSLDELPELINVLRGDMSLVGPRPLLAEYRTRYSAEQFRRHDVRPGLTGWAQVNGRNGLTWEQKFACDIWYVDHVSLGLDARILTMTVWCLLKPEGIQEPGQVTMQKFEGSQQ
jgi:sugar transferase EpsL